MRQQRNSHPTSGRQLASTLFRHKVLTGVGAIAALSLIFYVAGARPSSGSTQPRESTEGVATHHGPPAPRSGARKQAKAAGKPAFPPRTLASFREFAATGSASQVHELNRIERGLPSCPTPNIDVTVSPGLIGRPLEADLSAFFLKSGLLGSQCQAFLFAYHNRRDYQMHQNNGYTVGRVALTNNYRSRNLEVDTGVVTSSVFDPHTQFDFNFHAARS